MKEDAVYEVVDRPYPDQWWCRRLHGSPQEGWVNPLFLAPNYQSEGRSTQNQDGKPHKQVHWNTKEDYYPMYDSGHYNDNSLRDYDYDLNIKMSKISIPEAELTEVKGNSKDECALKRRLESILYMIILINLRKVCLIFNSNVRHVFIYIFSDYF